MTDLFDRQGRTIRLEPGRDATYEGDNNWSITIVVPGRAPRPDAVLLTSEVLPRLATGSFEREQALRLIAAFGDTL